VGELKKKSQKLQLMSIFVEKKNIEINFLRSLKTSSSYFSIQWRFNIPPFVFEQLSIDVCVEIPMFIDSLQNDFEVNVHWCTTKEF